MSGIRVVSAAPIVNALSGVVAIPLRDARPMVLSLVGRKDRCSRPVQALREVARDLVRERAPELARLGVG